MLRLQTFIMSHEYYPVSYIISGNITKKDFTELCKVAEDENAEICIINLSNKLDKNNTRYSISGYPKILSIDSSKKGYITKTKAILNQNTLLSIEHTDAVYGEITDLEYLLQGKYNYLTIRNEDNSNFYNYFLSHYKDFYSNLPLSIAPNMYSSFSVLYNYLWLGVITDVASELQISSSMIEYYSKLNISIPQMLKELNSLIMPLNLLKPFKIID